LLETKQVEALAQIQRVLLVQRLAHQRLALRADFLAIEGLGHEIADERDLEVLRLNADRGGDLELLGDVAQARHRPHGKYSDRAEKQVLLNKHLLVKFFLLGKAQHAYLLLLFLSDRNVAAATAVRIEALMAAVCRNFSAVVGLAWRTIRMSPSEMFRRS